MNDLTKEQAMLLFESQWWLGKGHREIAEFQLNTERLCMPFGGFHEAVEKALGRSVWTHEFADPKSLLNELHGERPAPSFQEILEMIPEAKRIVVTT